MATTFQEYVWFQTTEITSQDGYFPTTRKNEERPGITPFPGGMNSILDLLIVVCAGATIAATVILLFLMYKYYKKRRKPSDNVEIVRYQNRTVDCAEANQLQHSSGKEDELLRQNCSNGTDTTPARQQNTYTANEFYRDNEVGDEVTNTGNMYKQQSMGGSELSNKLKRNWKSEEDSVVHYENARLWKSKRDHADMPQSALDCNLTFANEATYQNVSGVR